MTDGEASGGRLGVSRTNVAEPDTGLGPFLEAVHRRYQGTDWTDYDPIAVPLAYERQVDREVMGFIAAALAFGNVKAILGSLAVIQRRLGDRPADKLAEAERSNLLRANRGFRYRWIDGRDLTNLLGALGRAVAEYGGLEPLFARGMTPEAPDILGGAASLIDGLNSYIPQRDRSRRGTRYLLTDVRGGSAAKRIHMFLRWMVRDEAPDLGLWTSARPAQLIMPMDTHTARISRYVGLTSRPVADGRMASEVTEALRIIDPQDPVRFDFSMSRLGILGHCLQRRDDTVCPSCPLDGVCTL